LPIRLAYTYPVWQGHSDRLFSWLPMLAIVAVTLVLWRYRRRGTRALLLAWSIYCVALLPAMGLTEKLVIADRYQHMALIALVALAAAGWDTWRRSAPGSRLVLPYAAAVLIIGAYAVLTWRQSAVYADSVTLMQAAVDSYPNSALAHHNVAFALLGAGRLREAREHLEYALRLEPDCVDAHNTLAATFSEAGHSREAIPHLEAVLRLAPDDPSALSNLGAALREAGEPEQAVAYLQRALQVKPDSASHRNLGKALLQLGRPAEAIEQFRQALQMDGDDTDARWQLESALTAPQASSRKPDGPGS
jgi:tetratricopeptide (TPR) repeat protein